MSFLAIVFDGIFNPSDCGKKKKKFQKKLNYEETFTFLKCHWK